MSANSTILKAVPFILVVETDSYAGNFEREMCAFMTGCIGECEVGKKYVEEAREALDEQDPEWADILNEFSMHVPDDHGCCRPTSIYRAKEDDSYTSVAIFFESIEYFPDGLLQFLKKRAFEFPARRAANKDYGSSVPVTIKDVYLIKQEVTYKKSRLEI